MSEFGEPARPRRAFRRPGNLGQSSVQSLDTARISQAGVNTDEEITRLDSSQVRMNLQAEETTYKDALAAAAKSIQPSLAAFLQ